MKTIRVILSLVFGLFLLSGCDYEGTGPSPEQARVTVAAPAVEQKTAPRFTVVIVGEFYDPTAYGDKRRIYEITDNQTKVTYISVTGCSLSRKRQADDEAAEAAAEAAEAAAEALSSFDD